MVCLFPKSIAVQIFCGKTAVKAPQEQEGQIVQAGSAHNWLYHMEIPHPTSAAGASDLQATPGFSVAMLSKLTKNKYTISLSHRGFEGFYMCCLMVTTC